MKPGGRGLKFQLRVYVVHAGCGGIRLPFLGLEEDVMSLVWADEAV